MVCFGAGVAAWVAAAAVGYIALRIGAPDALPWPSGLAGDVTLHVAAIGLIAAGAQVLSRRLGQASRMQQAAQSDLDLASAVLDIAGCLVVVLDREGRILRFNRACEELTGYSAAEVEGTAIWRLLLLPEEARTTRARFQELRAQDYPNQQDNHWLTKDGQPRLIAWWNTALVGGEGLITHVVGTGIDITEHRAAEAQLRIAHSALEASLSAIAVSDMAGSLLYVNPAFVRLWGYDEEEEILGRPIPDFWQLNSPLAPAAGSALGDARQGELTIQRRDGTALEVQVASVLIRDEAGRPVRTLTSFSDVTPYKRARRALEESEHQYRLLAEHMTDVLWVHDAENRFTYVSPSVKRQQGYDPEEMVGHHTEEFMAPASTEASRRTKAQLARTGAGPDPLGPSATVELELTLKEGGTFWGESHMTLLRDERGKVVGTLGVTRDISDRKRAEEQLHRQREWLETTLASIRDAVIATDGTGVITFLNQAAAALTGWDSEEALGRPLDEVFCAVGPEPGELAPSPAIEALRCHCPVSATSGTALVTRQGYKVPIEAEAAPLRGRDGQTEGAVLAFRDVTDRLQAEILLRHRAYHDALTGLPNRALLRDRLDLALARARRQGTQVALLLFDLDNSKLVNDAFGHLAGDDLLKQLANRLSAHVRESETLARLGGDEFALVLDSVTAERAAAAARRLLGLVATPFTVGGRQIRITGSMGISVYPEDGTDSESLLKHADIALYHAKEAGKNAFRFHAPEMNTPILERFGVESGLHTALESGQLVAHYQPIFALPSGRLFAAEALMRWEHPELGLLLPKDFITVAEETGLSDAIDELALRQACRQSAAWDMLGDGGLSISVNISGRHFHREGLADLVSEVLAASHVDPGRLTLEITETAIMRNPHLSLSVMQQMKELGVRLALDDFGTGQSSLSALKRFPVDVLKVDKTFLAGIGVDDRDAVLLQAILGLAHSLHLEVVAEGVETEAQLEFLARHHCDAVQGYLLGRPMPAGRLEDLMRQPRSTIPVGSANSSRD